MTTLADRHFLRDLKPDNRKKARAIILNNIERHKRQLKLFEDTLIKYLKGRIEEDKKVLSSYQTIEQYIANEKKFSEWLNSLLSGGK